MKQLNTAPITLTANMPVKKGTLDFLQLAYTEGIAASVIAGLGSSYSPSAVYLLYGLELTSVGSGVYENAPGAVFYNGEVFLVPISSFDDVPFSGYVPVLDLSVTQYTQLVSGIQTADPVIFSDGSSNNVHNIRQAIIVSATSGSGTLTGTTAGDYRSLIPYATALGITGINSGIAALNTEVSALQAQTATLNTQLAIGSWQSPALSSGWGTFSVTGRYAKDGLRTVYLEGGYNSTSTSPSATLFTLAAGYWPVSDKYVSCWLYNPQGSGSYSQVLILISAEDGTVKFQVPAQLPNTVVGWVVFLDTSFITTP